MKNIIFYKEVVNKIDFKHIATKIVNLTLVNPRARIVKITINFIKDGEIKDYYYYGNYNLAIVEKNGLKEHHSQIENFFKVNNEINAVSETLKKRFIEWDYSPHNLFRKEKLNDLDLIKKYSFLRDEEFTDQFDLEDFMVIYREYKFLITIQYSNKTK